MYSSVSYWYQAYKSIWDDPFHFDLCVTVLSSIKVLGTGWIVGLLQSVLQVVMEYYNNALTLTNHISLKCEAGWFF